MLKWFRKKEAEAESTEPSASEDSDICLEEDQADTSVVAPPDGAAVASDETSPAPDDNPDFIEDADVTGETEAAPESKGLFSRLTGGLGKTRGGMVRRLKSAIGLSKKVDEALLEEIEEILIESDVGAHSAMRIVEDLRKLGRDREAHDSEALAAIVRESIEEILCQGQRPLRLTENCPEIVLFVGVNGTGKTTTIGKLSLELVGEGRKVMLVAADTFRAAAVEQLAIWARRTGATFISSPEGTDPAAVCFDALDSARADPPDVILIDTAGRLHTKINLMDELVKIVRVIRKVYPDAPHETIVTLDATTGQNALEQVRVFREVAEVTGIVMTKLDGTARGGILIAIKDAHPDLPIFKIGIGEAPEDLRDFDAAEFARALFASESET